MLRSAKMSCFVLIVLVAGVQAQQVLPSSTSPGESVLFTIISPTAETYLVNVSMLRVEATPAVKSIEFFVDGKSICPVVEKAPFECEFDAGPPPIAARQVRIVANLIDGTRTIRTVRTKSIDEIIVVPAVLVPVVVIDWQERFVRGLSREAFRVLENGVPQTITTFETENIPVDVVVVIDISGSMVGSMPTMKQAIKRFLAIPRTIDRVTVMAFNDRASVVAKHDADPAKRLAAIDSLEAFGGTSLYDAILQGIDLLGDEVSRKAIVVFTDGDDRNSLAPLGPVESRVRQSEATLYMITQGKGARVEAVRQVIDRLATISGGRAFPIEKIDELQKSLETVMNDLTHQYLLGYEPLNPNNDGTVQKDHSYHTKPVPPDPRSRRIRAQSNRTGEQPAVSRETVGFGQTESFTRYLRPLNQLFKDSILIRELR